MSPQNTLLIGIFLLGGITFFYRFAFIHSKGRQFADRIPKDFLRLLAPATFSAIIANNLLTSQGNPTEFNQKVIVAVLSLAVAYFTKSVMITLIFGLSFLAALQYFLPTM